MTSFERLRPVQEYKLANRSRFTRLDSVCICLIESHDVIHDRRRFVNRAKAVVSVVRWSLSRMYEEIQPEIEFMRIDGPGVVPEINRRCCPRRRDPDAGYVMSYKCEFVSPKDNPDGRKYQFDAVTPNQTRAPNSPHLLQS